MRSPLAPVVRISFGLAVLTCTLLLALDLVGALPRPTDETAEERVRLCETLAAQVAASSETKDFAAVRAALQVAVRRNEDVLSAALRSEGGRLLVEAGDHRSLWDPPHGDGSTSTHVRLPFYRNGEPWASLEVRFRRATPESWALALLDRPLVRLLFLMGGLGFLAYGVFMRRTLRHLDPSAVIPARVHAALDVMTEGVLLVDTEERVVLANAAFCERLGRDLSSLLGVRASSLDWRLQSRPGEAEPFPWIEALREGRQSTGTPLRIEHDRDERCFLVNSSPVLDGWGKPKGAIVTFDDVTELEQKTADLERANAELEKSREEIRLQNEELQVLARSDPLTGVSNRRAFMEHFELVFADAVLHGRQLALLMSDIDHFKRVNDTHGHATGDEVIRRVAEAVGTEIRATDAVCRYGGEEFCVALPGASLEAAVAVAERIRRKIGAPGFTRVPITSSFGVSTVRFGATKLAELIDQADEALYAAKHAGRNRVVTWDQREAAEAEASAPGKERA